MFKVLLLQRRYDLPDPGVEEALVDRLSFRAFAGFSLEDTTPDQSTIWHFREQLAKRRLMEPNIIRVDPDARFGVNNERRRYQFGYKLHVAMDRGSDLVRAAAVTPANIQEIKQATGLVQGDEMAVYANRGYDARQRVCPAYTVRECRGSNIWYRRTYDNETETRTSSPTES